MTLNSELEMNPEVPEDWGMLHCPRGFYHQTNWVWTGANPDGKFGGWKDRHILWCDSCVTTLAISE